MKFFLDSSILLAVAGSAHGSSRGLFDLQQSGGWSLLYSPYVGSGRKSVMGVGPNEAMTRIPIAGREWMRDHSSKHQEFHRESGGCQPGERQPQGGWTAKAVRCAAGRNPPNQKMSPGIQPPLPDRSRRFFSDSWCPNPKKRHHEHKTIPTTLPHHGGLGTGSLFPAC